MVRTESSNISKKDDTTVRSILKSDVLKELELGKRCGFEQGEDKNKITYTQRVVPSTYISRFTSHGFNSLSTSNVFKTVCAHSARGKGTHVSLSTVLALLGYSLLTICAWSLVGQPSPLHLLLLRCFFSCWVLQVNSRKQTSPATLAEQMELRRHNKYFKEAHCIFST